MKENDPLGKYRSAVLLGAVFLLSFCLISYEIVLSRLLSVLLSYHYVFLVLSLALLGLGLGGMFVHFFMAKEPEKENPLDRPTLIASLFSLAVPLSSTAVILIGAMDGGEMSLVVYGCVLLPPFLSAGALLAVVYRTFPSISPLVYGADLIGAAGGAFGAVFLLDCFGGIDSVFGLGVIAAVSAVLFSAMGKRARKKGQIVSLTAALAVAILFIADLAGVIPLDVPVGANSAKEIHDALSTFRGKIVETSWSAFGRTDVVEFDDYPDHKDIYIDGTAGSPMYRFNGDPDDPGPAILDLKKSFPGFFPFHRLKEEERDNALIIGPGGGRDILLALMGGVRHVTAVEVNKDLIDVVRKYSSFNGGIFSESDHIRIVFGEGRHFLKRRRERYDVIFLSLPVTNTSRSLEGYALTENFLFTVESVGEYLDHLTSEGRLAIVGHNDAELLRLLVLSLTALQKKGIGTREAMQRLYAVGSEDYLVLVLKNEPFDPKEIFGLYEAMFRFDLAPGLSYFPYVMQPGGLNPALAALGAGRLSLDELENIVKEKGYDIGPVTDNGPFFYKFKPGPPGPVTVAFWSAVGLLVCILAVPVVFRKKTVSGMNPASKGGAFPYGKVLKSAVLFSMLGMGFMLIEISLIQRFMLFLGHPVLSLAVSLAALLGWAGVGSLWCGRVSPDKVHRSVAAAALFISVAVLGYNYLLPFVFDSLLGLNLFLRITVSILILFPLGFLLGLPFPLGIRRLEKWKLEGCIPWMWGLNGVGSVIGSALTVLVAVLFGFSQALFVGAGCYFVIFIFFITDFSKSGTMHPGHVSVDR